MARVPVNGIRLHYEEVGQGIPLVFVHEFAGEAQSWHLQVRFFARRYRTITFQRPRLPAVRPDGAERLPQDQAVEDIRDLLDALGIERAYVCGLSMGGGPSTSGSAIRTGRCRWWWLAAGTVAWRRNARSGSGTSRPRLSGSSPSPWRCSPTSTVRGRRGSSSRTRIRGLAGVPRPVRGPVRARSRPHDARGPADTAVGLRARAGARGPDGPDPHSHGG